MSIASSLLAEYDQEMTATRAYLERTPWDRAAWYPHEKSMSLGRLATHVAEMGAWCAMTFEVSELDVQMPRDEATNPSVARSHAELLATFDRNVLAGRRALAAAADSAFAEPWTLKAGPHTIFTIPRMAVHRRFVMNHLCHHRGQLSVYLRLVGAALPSTYGPSADEGGRPQR